MIFSYLIKGRREPGDTVPVTIIRDRKRITVPVELSHWSNNLSLIPENDTGEQVEYLVNGGIVIRELTADYLRAHGSHWQKIVDPRLVHLYLTQKHAAVEDEEHVVILSRVLADPINTGYQSFHNDLITHLNDQPVRNMADVFRIVEKALSCDHVGMVYY